MSEGCKTEKEGFKKFLGLFFPFLLVTFSNSLYLLVEKLFLARISSEAMQAAVNVAYICQIFQGSCIALAMMAQVYVGRCFGAQKNKAIGPGIWQYVWFSLFSSFLTIPLSLLLGYYYFRDTEIQQTALNYFYLMTGINFIYPLGAALSCFYSGQGKTRLVLFSSIGSQALKIGIGYLLIFGKGGFPSLELMGGALSTLIAHGFFCGILFFIFINKKHRLLNNTFQWKFQWNLFKECIYPGFMRALNRILGFSCWAAIAHLMVVRGGEYALTLSLGGTLFFFLPCLAEALSQAQMTIIAQLLGAGKSAALKITSKTGYIVALAICLLCVGPFLLFPSYTCHSMFPMLELEESMIRQLFFGMFASFSWCVISYIPISFILAFKDMRFSLFMGIVSWVNGYLLMFYFLEIVEISANQFWLALSLMHATTALFYYLRSRWLTKQLERQPLFAIN